MLNNTWFKLAVVSLTGIVISFAVLWGISQFNGTTTYGSMNMGFGNQSNGMQMGQQQNGIQNDQQNGMNMQGNMSTQAGMNNQGLTNGGMQGGMGMMSGMMSGMDKMQSSGGGMGMH